MANAMTSSEMNVSNVTFSAVKALENGGKIIYMNNGEGINPIYIQTPEMTIPFDGNYFADDGVQDESLSKSGKYSYNLSMDNIDSNDKMNHFYTTLCSLDEHIKKEAKKNSASWFKKPKISEDTINELYTPIVKVSVDENGEPNGKWAPKITFKIKKKDGRFVNFVVYDKSKTYFDINKETETPVDIRNVVMKGALVKVVLKCNGIWIANGKFGCGWVAEQMRIKIPEGGLRDFAILSDSDESDDEGVEKSLDETVMIEDSDEEVKDETSPSPPPEPKKKTRKVKVKSK